MAESSKYTYDEWVGRVRPDPRNTDPLTLLQGYIGQSTESGHIRVYSDETLNSFVEVPEDAIVYAQQLSQAESSLGGSKLWLRSDVVITYGDPKSANRPKTTFLEGDLMQQYTTQYGGGYDPTGGMGAYGGQFMATFVNCKSVKINQCEPKLNSVPIQHCLAKTVVGANCPPVKSVFITGCFDIKTKVAAVCLPIATGFACPSWAGCLPTGYTTNGINPGPVVQPEGLVGQPNMTQYGEAYDPTGGMGVYGGQPGEQGGQFMASLACPTGPIPPITVPFTICKTNWHTIVRTRCSFSTCFRTLCGPATCIPVICHPHVPGGGCNGISVFPTPGSIACNPGGPVVQPGGFMGQPDTTMMGGYYGQFNPYTTLY